MDRDLSVIHQFQLPNGLCLAGPGGDYACVWIRDNIYAAIGLEAGGDRARASHIYHALMDILHRYHEKLDWVIWQKPTADWQYIHPRYNQQGREINGLWGWKQHDAIGLLLYQIACRQDQRGDLLRPDDWHLLQRLVWYLERIEYWHNPDNGMWEENLEIHASSVAAGVRALEKIRCLGVMVSDDAIGKGWEALNQLLPAESATKANDLALLSLIWPLGIVDRPEIVAHVEKALVRDHGVVRYLGDQYHYKGGEAEWTMGLPWLGLCCHVLGDPVAAQRYLMWSDKLYTHDNQLPECYAGSIPCEHTPLVWAHALKLTLAATIASH